MTKGFIEYLNEKFFGKWADERDEKKQKATTEAKVQSGHTGGRHIDGAQNANVNLSAAERALDNFNKIHNESAHGSQDGPLRFAGDEDTRSVFEDKSWAVSTDAKDDNQLISAFKAYTLGQVPADQYERKDLPVYLTALASALIENQRSTWAFEGYHGRKKQDSRLMVVMNQALSEAGKEVYKRLNLADIVSADQSAKVTLDDEHYLGDNFPVVAYMESRDEFGVSTLKRAIYVPIKEKDKVAADPKAVAAAATPAGTSYKIVVVDTSYAKEAGYLADLQMKEYGSVASSFAKRQSFTGGINSAPAPAAPASYSAGQAGSGAMTPAQVQAHINP